MTLSRQLWIAIIVVMVLAFGGTFAISMISARDYLEQQLSLKNRDNAASLALTLSQMDKDQATLELLISAQFDSGHYRIVSLTDMEGNILVERSNPPLDFSGPEWLTYIFPFQVAAGEALIQDGWSQFGQLKIESDSSFAYVNLWQETRKLAGWFGFGIFACGLIGTLFLRVITRPLVEVVGQAEAIGERRFVTIPLPRTIEFKRVVAAMNSLAERVKAMLAEESERLEVLKLQAHHDSLTGLLLRQQFIHQAEAVLSHEDGAAIGSLVLGRVVGLEEVNRSLGRDVADQLLRRIGEQLRNLVAHKDGWIAGRIGGADFALLVAGKDDALVFARELSAQMHLAANEANLAGERLLPVGATVFGPGDSLSQILSRADGALITAERDGGMAVQIADPHATRVAISDLKSWKKALHNALQPKSVRLASYPVVDCKGRLIHEECPVRVKLDGEWQTAAVVMPWIARLGLLPVMDSLVVHEALQGLTDLDRQMGIHISAEALCDQEFRDTLSNQLREAPEDVPKRLWLEIPESGAFRHLEQFRMLCAELKPFGCRIGLEHVGTHLSRIGQLHELGLDFVKIDSSLCREIETHVGSQALVRGLCTIAHTIGLKVIAEGVKTDAEIALLPGLGLDGMTGPGVSVK